MKNSINPVLVKQTYETPKLERHQHYVQVTGTSFGIGAANRLHVPDLDRINLGGEQ
jgi:hypothetical protein